MTRVDTEIRPHLGGRDGEHVRIAMPTVALWVNLPGAGKEWGDRARRELAEDVEWQQLLKETGRLFGHR